MKSFILLTYVFALASFGLAQDRNYSIEIALEDGSIDRSAAEEIATVTILNKAKEDLKSEGLGQIEFTFATCGSDSGESLFCRGGFSKFTAKADIPKARIRTNEKFEFRINLAKLLWENSWTVPSPPSFRQIRDQNIHFYARTEILTGYKDVAATDTKDGSQKVRKEPVFRFTYSNVIDVVLQ